MVEEKAKQNFIAAIIAVLVSSGFGVAGLTFDDAFNDELSGYYVCPLDLDVQPFARLSSTGARGYPFLDSTKGYKDCKSSTERSSWVPLREYAESIGIDPYTFIQPPTMPDSSTTNIWGTQYSCSPEGCEELA